MRSIFTCRLKDQSVEQLKMLDTEQRRITENPCKRTISIFNNVPEASPIYKEVCQEISDRYIATKKREGSKSITLKLKKTSIACIGDEMLENDVDANERRKHLGIN